MKKKSRLIIALISLLVLTAIAAAIPAAAASSVKESDFLKAPEKTLVKGVDYAYSFAVVGDTQTLNVQDAANGTENMKKIYEWIVRNKDAKGISFVMGLGDITDTFKSSGTHYAKEWVNAKEALALLDNADMPYSLVRGNHDISAGLNATFGKGSDYYSSIEKLASTTDAEGRAMGGFFGEYTDETGTAYKIENSYQKIVIGADKYMIVTLDWAPSEEAVVWLNGIISENPDYKVIATLHQFMSNDSCITDDVDATLPHEQIGDSNWGEAASGGTVLPRELWENALKKHANVEMILCGHVDVDDIKRTQLRGENGNTVTCMLIDAQTVDKDFGPVGMVAMLYFSESGEVVNVEYISAIRDLDGDDSTGAYLKAGNQFSIKLEYEDGWTKTPYGYVLTEEYNKHTFLLIADDDGNIESDNVYIGGYDRWIESSSAGALVAVKNYYNFGGLEARKPKNVYVYMTKDYDGSSDANYNAICDSPGGIILDLGGHEFIQSSRMFDAYQRRSDAVTRITLKNGTVSMKGTAQLIALQSNANGNGGSMEIYLEDLTVKLASNSTSAVTTYNGSTASNSTNTVTVTNCTFDTTAATGGVNIFNLKDAYDNNDTKLVVRGSKVISNSDLNPALALLHRGDSVKAEKYEGSYLTFEVRDGAFAPSCLGFSGANGESFEFVLINDGNDTDTYQLSEKAIAEPGSRGMISVWLIGGQSNASGYAVDLPTDAATDPRFENGFENVLYFGYADDNKITAFTPVKMGMGTRMGRSGAEIGIASALGDSDSMNAVIKLGRGASYLYPDPSPTVSTNYGTWTSPSYIEENDISTEGNRVGALYNDFIDTVKAGLELLIEDGYTPVIRGMWWMQGEAETSREALANEYDELLTALIGDLRSDLSKVSGSDLSNMPFVYGLIGVNDEKNAEGNFVYNQPAYISTVVAAQKSVAESVHGAYTVSPDGLVRRDQWHFIADAQQYLGEQLVLKVSEVEGKYNLTFDGEYVSASGIGAYGVGENITVKFTVAEGYVVYKATVKIGNGAETEIDISSGEYSFSMPSDNVHITVLASNPSDEVTKYGVIPVAYKDGTKYPFILFEGGSFVQAYTTWKQLINNLGNLNKNLPSTVLMRADYNTTACGANATSNLHLVDELTIDLDGHTLTRGEYHIFNAYRYDAAFHTTVLVKNGTIKNEKNYSVPLCFNGKGTADVDAGFDFTFENVTFTSTDTFTGRMVVECFSDGTYGSSNTVTFNSCDFIIASSTVTKLFQVDEAKSQNKYDVKITINGGSVTDNYGTLTHFGTVSAERVEGEGTPDTITFGSYNGEEFVYNCISGKTPVSHAYTSHNGKSMSFLASGNSYTLGEDAVTSYGLIPYSSGCTDSRAYPFAFFRGGKFVEAYTGWNAMLARGWAMFDDKVGREGVLLVREDYSTDKETSSSQSLYAIRGHLTIDLDGHTLTRGSYHLFQVMAKYANASDKPVPTTITIKNGRIEAKNNTPFAINTNNSAGFDDTFYFNFENVTFAHTKGSTAADLVFVTFTNGSYNTGVVASFDNCVFDLTGASKKTTIFNMKEASGAAKTSDITLKGCTVKTNDLSYFNLSTLTTGDTLTIDKNSAGRYLSISLPSGTAAPDTKYTVANNGYSYVFGMKAENADRVVYTLSPEELSALRLKTNVTLYSDFVLNAYFPVLTGISSVKVNGISVAFKNLETTEIDGKLYYILPTEVASSEAAEDIAVSITLTYGEDSFSAKWTLGVVKYAEKALATEQTETTKMMLRDMLSYVRASYKYFASVGAVTPEACEIATKKIDAIIGGDYDENNAPVMEESAVLDPEGLSKATVSLGAKISFVFYPTEDAEKYTFTMGGAKLETEVKADGYIIVTTYAYAVRETVEYTVEGTDISGSYNLKAYYEYMAGEGNGSAELIALVERLFKYSESCEAYRNEVNS